MSKITMVTGGARSGKSGFAESLLQHKDDVLYIATSIPFDEEMKDRIEKHKLRRPAEWKTLECYKDIDKHLLARSEKNILLDCLTIMVTNLMFYYEKDWDTIGMDRINEIEGLIISEVQNLINCVRKQDMNMIVVTNELGMGIVPSTKLSRLFRDIAGNINQVVARECDEVSFLVSGIPTKIK